MLMNTVPKILVVDDTPANLVVMNAVLNGLDAEVVTANSGSEALTQVLNHEFALILLDIQMPGMNGYEVAQIIRNEQSTRDIPIIFVTALQQSEENEMQAYQTGAVDFIEKPINTPILLSKVNVFLGLYSAKERLKQEEKNTRATLESIPDPILVVRQNSIVYANDSAKLFANKISQEKIAVFDDLSQFFSFDDKSLHMIEDLIESAIHSNASLDASHDLVFNLDTQKRLIYELRATPLMAFEENAEMVVLVFHDVSETRSLSDRLEHQAQHDSLTGLVNRRYFDVLYRSAVQRIKRSDKLIALFNIDLDGFKVVNDTLGHFAGDLAIKEAAQRILACLREQDVLARFGGDEFCVLLDQADSIEDLIIPAKRIIKALSAKFVINHEQCSLKASLGISIVDAKDKRDCEAIFSDADLAMYQAKSVGGNGYQLFEADMRVNANKKMALLFDLEIAVKERQFILFYQPQVDIKTGSLIGLEALIRWQHPTQGLIPPAGFIDVLENSEFMIEAGAWVIDEACRQLNEWKKQGLPMPCVSVNVSPKQFLQHDFPQQVDKTLKKYQLDARYLGIEITETLFMNLDHVIENNIFALSEMGCKLSLDDFGTGYSSLAYLIRFPIDVLKIDQVFVQGLLANSQYQSLVTAIISMAKGFDDMQIIAEGVEENEQLDVLKNMKCDYYQGYLYSKPLPSLFIEELLMKTAH